MLILERPAGADGRRAIQAQREARTASLATRAALGVGPPLTRGGLYAASGVQVVADEWCIGDGCRGFNFRETRRGKGCEAGTWQAPRWIVR
jgi:hypothetical protein